MRVSTAQQLKRELQKSYNLIASDFSKSRSHPWPEFDFFAQYIKKGAKVLDLGCGNGRLYNSLEEKEVNYTGVDFCGELLELAKKLHPGQSFVQQDATELDLEETFDVIISIAAFHHIPSRKLRSQTLKKLFDHLEDDGVLLLSVWNLWQWKYWKPLLKGFLKGLFSLFSSDPRDIFVPFGKQKVPRYYHAFFSGELKRLLRSHSFQLVEHRRSGHNLLFVCRKNMAVAPANPLFSENQRFRKGLESSPSTSFSHGS